MLWLLYQSISKITFQNFLMLIQVLGTVCGRTGRGCVGCAGRDTRARNTSTVTRWRTRMRGPTLVPRVPRPSSATSICRATSSSTRARRWSCVGSAARPSTARTTCANTLRVTTTSAAERWALALPQQWTTTRSCQRASCCRLQRLSSRPRRLSGSASLTTELVKSKV